MKRGTKAIAGGVIISAVNIGSYATMSNYVDPIAKLFNVDVSAVSLIFTIHALVCGVFSVFVGNLIKRVRVKPLIGAGSVMLLAFFVSVFFAKSMTPIYISMIFKGLSFVLTGYVMSETIITWWADKNPGRAMDFIVIGLSVAAFVISPMVAKGIILFGVRTTALIHGLICFALTLLADIFLVSEKPEYYGMKNENTEEAEAEETVEKDKTVLKTYPVWCICIMMFLFNLAFNGFNNNASVYYQSIGVDAMQASYGISIYGIVSVAWSYLHGYITDKKGPGTANAVCALTAAVILFAAVFLRGFGGVVIIALLVGSMSICGTMGSVMLSSIYGKNTGSTFIGFILAAAGFGSMVGTPLAAIFYDFTGSYNGFLFFASGCALVSMVLSLVSTSEKAKLSVKKHFEAKQK